MSAPNDQPGQHERELGGGELLVERVDGRLGIQPLEVAFVVGTLAALDAAEVEPQARHPDGRERVEQRADDDRAHRAAELGMRVAQHHAARAATFARARARPRGSARRR